MSKLTDVLGIPNFFEKKSTFRNLPDKTPQAIATKPKGTIAPARSSEPNYPPGSLYSFDNDKRLIKPGYQFEVIPLIRRLSLGNQSVSQALSNIVNLANTGHEIQFDSSVSADQIAEMKLHLENVVPSWLYGVSGTHGLMNKFISQAMISGAVCGEAVVNEKFTGLYRVVMPNPETIRFVYNRKTITYEPWQKTLRLLDGNYNGVANEFGLNKLNSNSFKYYAINGDTESPYGNPPYLPSLSPLEDQKSMLANIKFIIQQIGIMGFWEVLVDKPTQNDLETTAQYKARVESYLKETKSNLMTSFKDGIMVGLQDDHEFKFNSATASAAGVSELFQQNESLVSEALKRDPAMAGAGGQEGNMTIVFTKLLSELTNLQSTCNALVKFFYELELRLAGYNFKWIKVVSNASTVQDDLKMQQGQEIKIRNARQKRADGITSSDQHARELGYDKAHQPKPNLDFTPIKSTDSTNPSDTSKKKKTREDGKNKSDKKVRDKNAPQGTIKK